MYSRVICKLVIIVIFLCPFLHCKALRTAMYKRYINSIIIIIILINLFITFFILLVIYSVWQNNKIK